MSDINNAWRITMVCYDPTGEIDDPEELFVTVVDEQDGISGKMSRRWGNIHNHVVCEHVAAPDDGRLDSFEAHAVFKW